MSLPDAFFLICLSLYQGLLWIFPLAFIGIIREVFIKGDLPIKLKVDFMRTSGTCGNEPSYKWPNETDIQLVESKFVIFVGCIPQTSTKGRLWVMPDSQTVDNIYNKYKDKYF